MAFKITSKMVKSRRCIGCINGYALHYLDAPSKDGLRDGWACKQCFVSKLHEDEELLLALFGAIRAAIRNFDDKHSDLFVNDDKQEYYEWCYKKHKVLHDCKLAIDQLMKCKDTEALKRAKKNYDREYFKEVK